METSVMKSFFVLYLILCFTYVTGNLPKSYTPYEFLGIPNTRIDTLSLNSNSPHTNHMNRQQIIHTAMQSYPVPTLGKQTKNSVYYSNEYPHVSNGLSEEQENLRETYRSSNQQNRSFPQVSTRQNYDTWASRPFQDTPPIFTAPAIIDSESAEKASPKFNLIEPLTTKMSSKMSGLMQLVLALLGSGSNNLITKGFKDVIIDGIIKPLLVAKGGIKVLISKLTIPFISLLLINLEVLVTVWWLWDDCPEPVKPVYSTPPNDYSNNNYNTYNTTFR